MQIAKIWGRAIRTPMAVPIIATTGETAMRRWSIVGTVTIGRTADKTKQKRPGRFCFVF
jgi:hypothetical protein